MTDARPVGHVRLSYEIQSALGLAWDSIRGHKLRSFLTLLGVIIGVASVILVGSAIDGLGLYAEESTAKAFGSESFLVGQVVTANSRTEFFDKMRRNKPIKLAEDRYLQSVNAESTMYSHTARARSTRNGIISFPKTRRFSAYPPIWRISAISTSWRAGF
jgi:ABC-type antimicrobial peptide transport system permease subunit